MNESRHALKTMKEQPGCVTIAQAIDAGADRLRPIADNPRLEARLLLAHSLRLSRNDLIRDPARPVLTTIFDTLITRRTAHEPLARILGQREFWSMPFHVSPETLIPRPDSETLIEAALLAFAHQPPPRCIIDLGTGTGCLLLALLKEFPQAHGIGLDISPAAVRIAGDNALENGMNDRTIFLVSDWTNSIVGRFDLLISNPPYIRRQDIATLMPDVSHYEPIQALDGGPDGYDAYRMIVPRIPGLLTPNGVAILELGYGQANYVSDIAREAGLASSLRLDLSGTPRAIILNMAA